MNGLLEAILTAAHCGSHLSIPVHVWQARRPTSRGPLADPGLFTKLDASRVQTYTRAHDNVLLLRWMTQPIVCHTCDVANA